MTNFVINDFIKRHIFRSIERFDFYKNNPSVTTNDDEEMENIYDGPRLLEGCSEFDTHVSLNYPSIQTELENVTDIDAATYGLRTMVILQKIMRAGKDIIFSEGRNRFMFINDACTKATEDLSSTTQNES